MRAVVLRRSSLLFAALAVSGMVRANNIAWNNPAGGNFSTGANWVGNTPPGLLDTASFGLASSAGYTVTLTASPVNTQLAVGNDNVAFDLHGNTYTLSDTGSTAGNYSLDLGSASGGSLTVESSAGSGTMTAVYASIGDIAGQSATMAIAGHVNLTVAENLCVGVSGNGTLNVQGGSNVSDLVGSIGSATGSSGIATVSGSGSVWNTANDFYVGNHGTGSLTVQNGGRVINSQDSATFIGRNAQGSATVTGTNSSWSAQYMDIGYYAAGSINVQSGGSISDADATISCTATGPGTVTIGVGSSWNNSDDLNVGSATAGTLNIQGNVTVSNSFAISNHVGTLVNLSSGSLSVGYINTSNNPALFLGDGVSTGWTGGTLQITRSGLTVGSGGALGSNLTLGSGKSLQITGSGQTLAIISGSTLNVAGGSVLANTLSNAGTLSLPKGSNVEAVNPLVNTGLIDVSGGILQLDAGISGSTVRSQLQAGYNKGGWNGTSGITSTFANSHLAAALGYTTSGSVTKVFSTWYGDANGDGVVNSADLTSISNSGTTWQTGDFNYDGVVNEDDWSLFFLGSLFGSSNVSAALPEPTSLVMLLPMAGLLRRRR